MRKNFHLNLSKIISQKSLPEKNKSAEPTKKCFCLHLRPLPPFAPSNTRFYTLFAPAFLPSHRRTDPRQPFCTRSAGRIGKNAKNSRKKPPFLGVFSYMPISRVLSLQGSGSPFIWDDCCQPPLASDHCATPETAQNRTFLDLLPPRFTVPRLLPARAVSSYFTLSALPEIRRKQAVFFLWHCLVAGRHQPASRHFHR